MSKIAISPGATGNAVFTIQAPSTETSRTLVLPDNAGTVLTSASALAAANLSGRVPAANAPLGSVIQVVSVTKTNAFSTTGLDFFDVTGLSVSITPTSATSKFLIICSINGQGAVGASFLATRLMRDSTAIAIGDANSSAARATSSTGYTGDAGGQLNLSMTHLDSPATTSAVTYKVQASSLHSGTTAFINRAESNDGTYSRCMTASTITVMEIAA